MKKGISFFLAFAVFFSGLMLSGSSAYCWTTEISTSPVGHEVLTGDGAYDAGPYYRCSDFVEWFGGLFSSRSFPVVNTAGFGIKRIVSKVSHAVAPAVNAAKSVANTVASVVPAVAIASVLVGPGVAFAGAGGYVLLKWSGIWNKIAPYYGTYSDRTASLIAGTRYQDLKEYGLGNPYFYFDQEKTDNQKFHFLRRNNIKPYNTGVMIQEIENTGYGIKYKGIIEPIIAAVKSCNAPKRYVCIGGYDRINVIADHFAMGMVLHTVQDSYAHTIRENGTGIIREVKVYSPKDGSATDYRHEGPLTTLCTSWQSHDRIYKYDAGGWGLHGKLKAEARAAKSATTELLKLWKKRDQGWLYKSDSWLITYFFEQDGAEWGKIVNSICDHRRE